MNAVLHSNAAVAWGLVMYWLDLLHPANEFKKHFELVLADTPELRDEVFRVRHKVFSEELGFYKLRAEGRERDEHDEHSRHLLLRCLRTGTSAGCIRLVLASHERPAHRLPSEKICAGKIDPRDVDLTDLRRQGIAEISRLALAREFRHGRPAGRRKNAAARPRFGTPAHPRALYVQLGLYLGAIALAHRLEVKTVLFLTEPRLAAHFRRLGFPFRQVSGPVECHGTCVLSMADVGDPITRLPFYMRPFYRVVDGEIAVSLDSGRHAAGFHRFAKRHGRIRSSRIYADVAHSAGELRDLASSLLRLIPMHQG